nr:MAG TPA: hypothetical protein [Microviridae sp.]
MGISKYSTYTVYGIHYLYKAYLFLFTLLFVLNNK